MSSSPEISHPLIPKEESGSNEGVILRDSDSNMENSEEEKKLPTKRGIRQSMSNLFKAKKVDKLKVSSLIYILIASAFIIGICFEVIFSDAIQTKIDIHIIHGLQSVFLSHSEYGFSQIIGYILEYISNPFILSALVIFIYLTFDPLLGFKTSILLFTLIFIHAFLVTLVFREPRPFWVFTDINTYVCENTFTGPDIQLTLLVFVHFYLIRQLHHLKHIANLMAIILYLVMTFIDIWFLIFNVTNAKNFFYQEIMGVMLGAVFCFISLIYDRAVTRFSVKLGFLLRESRKYKFMCLLSVLIIYFVVTAVVLRINPKFAVKSHWIYNFQLHCNLRSDSILQAFSYTYNNIGFIFGIPAISFGISLANGYLTPLWFQTTLGKTILRGFLGVSLAIGIYVADFFVPHKDAATHFMFRYFLTINFVTYWVTGYYLVLCNWIGLTRLKPSEESPLGPPDIVEMSLASSGNLSDNQLDLSKEEEEKKEDEDYEPTTLVVPPDDEIDEETPLQQPPEEGKRKEE